VPTPRMRTPRPGRIQIAGIRPAQSSLARAMAMVLCLALTGWAVAGCDGRSAASGNGSSPPPAATITPVPSPSPAQADFSRVVQGDCLAGQAPWAEIPCDDSKADAKVVGLGIGGVTRAHSAQTSCPADTDEVFNSPDGGGYFCLRKLHPPHHARPGLGGGIVVVGDCLTKNGGNYAETPCDGSLDHPEYKVVDVREWKEGRCPNGRVQLSADRLGLKNYCAKKL
jgi:hypothetical protein